MLIDSKIWTDIERQAWQLPPAGLTVSSWADENRILPLTSAEPGPWRTERTPYLKDIMDSFTDPQVEEIVITGPGQCGKSEAVFNMIGYTVDIDPAQAMYVCARDEDVEDICNDRLEPMFRDSSDLQGHLLESPRALQAGRVFRFDRMNLYFAAAGSAAGLASKPISKLFLDEIDKYASMIGEEGSPINLAVRRTQTFSDKKIVYLCTLTTKTGATYLLLKHSRLHFRHQQCPLCGDFQVLKFARLKVEPADLRDPDIIAESESVYYQCEACGGRIGAEFAEQMRQSGKWVAEGQSINKNARITGIPLHSKRRMGFWITELISPWTPWNKLLAEWFEVNEKEKIKPGVLREFKNQALAQVWEEQGKRSDESELSKLRGSYSRNTIPDGCRILFAQADYHESEKEIERIDFAIWGFGENGINFCINRGAVSSFDALDKAIFGTRFLWSNPQNHQNEMELSINLMLIDSGFKPDKVYAYARKHSGLCIPTKGASTRQDTPLRYSELDKTSYKKRRKFVRAGDRLLLIDTQFFKDMVSGWFEPAYNEKGEKTADPFTKFFREAPQYLFDELSNEHSVKVFDKYGNASFRWQPVYTGAPTHSLDLAVLAAAAAWLRRVHLPGFFRGQAPVKKEEALPAKRGPVFRPIRTKY